MPYKDKDKQREYLKQYEIQRKERKAQWYQQHYSEDPGPWKKSVQARQQRARDFIQELKTGLSCKRCGFSDWRALDFHHTNGNSKDFSIANAISRCYSRERILQEIAKCEVLCSNCHRIWHWEEKHGQV
jgi:predicted HNH restriction endonuclease